MRVGLVTALFLVFSSLHASAALLRAIEGGPVAVNAGSGYVTTASPRTLKPGDRVRASANSQAEIVYDNGCIQTVRPNQTAVVSAQPTCSSGANFTNTALVIGGVVVAAGAVAVLATQGGGSASP